MTVLDERRKLRKDYNKPMKQMSLLKHMKSRGHHPPSCTKAKKVVEDAQKEATALVNETKKRAKNV